MKIDRFVKVMLVVIAVLLALNCATNLRGPVDAQTAAKFSYLHIEGGVSDELNGKTLRGLGVLDLRNGNEWIFTSNDHPVLVSKYNFDALDKVPTKQP